MPQAVRPLITRAREVEVLFPQGSIADGQSLPSYCAKGDACVFPILSTSVPAFSDHSLSPSIATTGLGRGGGGTQLLLDEILLPQDRSIHRRWPIVPFSFAQGDGSKRFVLFYLLHTWAKLAPMSTLQSVKSYGAMRTSME